MYFDQKPKLLIGRQNSCLNQCDFRHALMKETVLGGVNSKEYSLLSLPLSNSGQVSEELSFFLNNHWSYFIWQTNPQVLTLCMLSRWGGTQCEYSKKIIIHKLWQRPHPFLLGMARLASSKRSLHLQMPSRCSFAYRTQSNSETLPIKDTIWLHGHICLTRICIKIKQPLFRDTSCVCCLLEFNASINLVVFLFLKKIQVSQPVKRIYQ